jgi:cell division protein DivIC
MNKILPLRFQKYSFYIISSLILVVWLVFFDRSSIISQSKLLMDLKKLEKEKVFYENELKTIKKEEKLIMGSYNSLEKFGREKYLMKKEGETVFVLVDENDKLIDEKE